MALSTDKPTRGAYSIRMFYHGPDQLKYQITNKDGDVLEAGLVSTVGQGHRKLKRYAEAH